jgi:hypothetical protein
VLGSSDAAPVLKNATESVSARRVSWLRLARRVRRRQFVVLRYREVSIGLHLAGGDRTTPLAARAQQSGMPVIGFLSSAAPGP